MNMAGATELQHMLFMHAEAVAGTNRLQATATDAAHDHVRTCAVCIKDQSSDAFPVVNNDHHDHEANVCRRCFNRYIVGHIDAGDARIVCVECPERLHYEDVQKIVSKTSLLKYDKVMLKACVEEDAEFRYCMSAKCKSGQIHVGGHEVPVFRCNACDHKQCMSCDISWHEGETCDEYQARHDKDTVKTEAIIRKTSKACPGGCGARIERNGGCPHMLCTKCSTEFCWNCLGAWTGPGNHQRCAVDAQAATEAPLPPSERIEHRREVRRARQDLRDDENEEAYALITDTTTPCPKCKVRIEKDGGCDHMTCSQCSHQFCFQCSANYAMILQYDNRRHKRSCVYYAAPVTDHAMPIKTAIINSDNHTHDVEHSTIIPVASTKPRAFSKPTSKKKPTGITKKIVVTKKNSAVAKKKSTITKRKANVAKRAIAAPIIRRGTRTGLRSSTAAASGPLTRSQTAAQRVIR